MFRLFWSKPNNSIIFKSTVVNIICLLGMNHVKLFVLFCFVLFCIILGIKITLFELFWFILGYRLYTFNSATNWIPRSTICPSIPSSVSQVQRYFLIGKMTQNHPLQTASCNVFHTYSYSYLLLYLFMTKQRKVESLCLFACVNAQT